MIRLLWPVIGNMIAALFLVAACVAMVYERDQWAWFLLMGILFVQIPCFTPASSEGVDESAD